MWIRRLELTNFRSYATQRVSFSDGVTLFVGPNGQGKTNLIEAIYRVSTGQSHRSATDQPLVRLDASPTVIRLALETGERRERTIDVSLGGSRPRVRLDGQDQRRTGDVVGVLRTVLFAPEDLAIVRGDPAERRRFLDDILSQRRLSYTSAKADYDRVLRQRNQLLKQLRVLPKVSYETARDTIDVYTDQLVALAAPIIAARIRGLRSLFPGFVAGYHEISGKSESVRLRYRPSFHPDIEFNDADLHADSADSDTPSISEITDALRQSLVKYRHDEEQRGVTLVGPHRDDVDISLGALPAKGYASHGETWSLTLALKLATREVLTLDNDPPVVLLDDVFAELDERRRHHLSKACELFPQVIVSAAVRADVPLTGELYLVHKTNGVSGATKEST